MRKFEQLERQESRNSPGPIQFGNTGGNTPELRSLTAYVFAVKFKNKPNLELFPEGCKPVPQ